ncbi:MAG: hypothetical protein JSV64_00115 [Candidatus Bathyarchaeota archaeon]|jgi:predicted transcriptional regulator|nr:MAG: hypothetical protein JSV64_00115 [Candidatus Bathyarchaeota archaeon]
MNSGFAWKRRRRGSLSITIAILKAAQCGILKTHLIGSVALSYEQSKRYLGFLTSRGLIEKHSRLYKTTEKGMQLVKEFESSRLTRTLLVT